MRLSALPAVALVLMASCQAHRNAPTKTPGIERYPEARDLHEFCERERAKYGWPALGVGVIHRGKIVALGMAGERRRGSGETAAIDDPFNVGSCAKSITAIVAAKLVEQGRIAWDSRVMDVLPTVNKEALPVYADVTLEQLLGHRAGLDQWMNSNVRWSAWHRDHAEENATGERLLFAAAALRRPPKYTPGSRHYYCNDGYLIAGSMLEAAAGASYEDLVEQHVFGPLELATARFGSGGDEAMQGVEVWGHEPGRFSGTNPVKPDVAEFGRSPFGAPAGFLDCSVPDLLRYVDEHARGANGDGKLLGSESYARLHAPLEGQNYALGWETETTRDAAGRTIERSIFHGGYTGRSRANMWFCPESGWGTVIVCNDGRGDGAEMSAVFYELLRKMELVPAPTEGAR